MANSVDLVIGSEAIKQVESLISKLSIADAELLKISQSASQVSKVISGISTPSGLDKTVSSTTALNAQLEKQNAIITKLHADIAKKAEQSRLAEIRLQQQREKAFDSFEKNAQKEVAINAKNETAYQRIQNSVALLTKTYQDLAIRKQLGSTLTTKEEAQLASLSSRINTYQTALKNTDAIIQKNGRNVGNYASGYNALGNSINQLTREAPAFANSIQTGFMALSNNFAALQDAIKGIIAQNRILAAEGKPTVSVFKQLAGGAFSWTTAISIGITLLTIYGAKLVDLALGLGDVEKQLKNIEKAQKTYNSRIEDTNRNLEHQAELEKIRLKSAGATEKQLAEIDVETQKRKLKNYELDRDRANRLVKIEEEKILQRENLEKKLYKNTNTQNASAAQLARINANKRNQDAKKEEAKNSDEVLTKLRENALKAENLVKLEGQKLTKITAEQNVEKGKNTEDWLKYTYEANKKELELQLALIEQKVNNEDFYFTDRLTSLDSDFLKRVEIAKLDYDESFRLSKGNQDKQKTALIDFQLEKLKLIEDYNKKKNSLEQLDLDPITKMAESKTVIPADFKSVTDSAKNAVKSLRAPADELKETWKETFGSIAESAQQAGNIIAEFSQRNFENEYRRLEAQKDIALKFAGEGLAARQKIEEDYENKRIEIANRENKAKQKQAIFNIAIDTAQAIMATVGKTGFAGLPLALILGALGAAQIAMVASQKIPQYFDGTDNHIGGMMLVNDGAGAIFQEKVILPNGKEIMPEGRNVLMNAPKGTKVLTHEQQIMQMLSERGISMNTKYSQNNGMTAQEMDNVMAKHFSKIQTNNTTFDRKGFRSWSESNGNKTIQNNNRVSGTGFSV